MSESPLTGVRVQKQTLILEIALPDFYCEDYRVDGEDEIMNQTLREACESDSPTPEQLGDVALEDSGLTTDRINLSILLGSKDGNFLERVKGQLVGSRIVPRTSDHELSDDTRLDEYEERERV